MAGLRPEHRTIMSDRKYRQRGYQDEPQAARPEGAGGAASAEAGPRAGTSAAGRRRTEDAEPDGGARSVPLRALRQPAVAAGRRRQPLPEVRRRSAQLRAVRVVRHQRALGVHAERRSCRRASRRRTRATTARCSRRARPSSVRPARRRTGRQRQLVRQLDQQRRRRSTIFQVGAGLACHAAAGTLASSL